MDIETKAATAWKRELRELADADEYEQMKAATLARLAAAEKALPVARRVITLPIDDVKALLALAEKAVKGARPRGRA